MAITISYPIGAPTVTLTIPGSGWDEPSGYLSSDDIVRAIDGTLRSLRTFRKRRKALKWDYLTLAQKVSLETLYAWGQAFTFADAVDTANQFDALFMSAPEFQQIASGAWAGSGEIEEI